jgi:hypothetical protein
MNRIGKFLAATHQSASIVLTCGAQVMPIRPLPLSHRNLSSG